MTDPIDEARERLLDKVRDLARLYWGNKRGGRDWAIVEIIMVDADAYALAAVAEYEDREGCNWAKYEALDGRRCVHYAEGRHPRYQGEPLRQCRLALREQLEPSPDPVD